ncbi:iron chelate uptake ABC transporter family permease subunit [Embleya sp. NPDC055664]
MCAATGRAVAGERRSARHRRPVRGPAGLGGSSSGRRLRPASAAPGGVAAARPGVSAAAFLGSVATGALLCALGRRRGRPAPTRLVLASVAIGYVFLSATSYVQLRATPTELRTVMFRTPAGVAGARYPVRLTIDADHRRLLPLTALLGAVHPVPVDLLSRTLNRPNELPLGILTALLGAPRCDDRAIPTRRRRLAGVDTSALLRAAPRVARAWEREVVWPRLLHLVVGEGAGNGFV